MKRFALLGFPEGLARQDIAPTSIWGDGKSKSYSILLAKSLLLNIPDLVRYGLRLTHPTTNYQLSIINYQLI